MYIYNYIYIIIYIIICVYIYNINYLSFSRVPTFQTHPTFGSSAIPSQRPKGRYSQSCTCNVAALMAWTLVCACFTTSGRCLNFLPMAVSTCCPWNHHQKEMALLLMGEVKWVDKAQRVLPKNHISTSVTCRMA